MPAAIDHTGKTFGKLTAIERISQKGQKTKYRCHCECGNEIIVTSSNLTTGNTKSCGKCARRAPNELDLTNQRFGRLIALKLEYRKNGQSYWRCKCDCGNEVVVWLGNLRKGNTKSCGCLGKENRERIYKENIKDISGQRFGKLVALYPLEKRIDSYVAWHCKCDCGAEVDVRSTNLICGHTISCGCARSTGEEYISNILSENNIQFFRNYYFKDCKFNNTSPLYFDFYLPEYNTVIEFDGEQHYQIGRGYFSSQDTFERRKERDKTKNNYCFDKKINIIRIPYTEKKNLCLEMLLPDTSKYLLKP